MATSKQTKAAQLTPVCAIGASAGGVQALSRLFRRLDPELGLAYVVIVHLSPDAPSQLAAILSSCTSMSVSEVTGKTNSDLQNLIAATEIGTLFLGPQLHIKLYTPMVARLFNITDADIGRAITDFTHNLNYDRLAIDAQAVRRDLAPLEHEILTTDDRRLFMRIRPYRTVDDRIDGIVVTFVDITSRYLAETRLSESEERFRRLVEGSAVAVWEMDIHGRMVGPSPSWQAFTGQSPADAEGDGWLNAVHPEDRTDVRSRWEVGISSRRVVDVDFRLREAPDRWRWVKAKAATLVGRGGEVRRWIGMCIDIDEPKRLEDRQAVLVAELQHRTRNLIGVVKGMAVQTIESSKSLSQFQKVFEERLQALSRVQGMLSRAEQEPITFGALVSLEIEALASDAQKSRITMDGPEVILPRSLAQTMSLAMHELATNATKYGSLVNDKGRLSVTWTEKTGKTGRRLLIDWLEEGLDLERELKGPMTKGFGRQLIEEALPYSHGARTKFELHKTGVHCTIDVPLETASE